MIGEQLEKAEQLKKLLDELDVIVTATYGEQEQIRSAHVRIDLDTVYIDTGICTG